MSALNIHDALGGGGAHTYRGQRIQDTGYGIQHNVTFSYAEKTATLLGLEAFRLQNVGTSLFIVTRSVTANTQPNATHPYTLSGR